MDSLYEHLKEYSKTDFYPYHMPGHKRRLCGQLPHDMISLDITEIDNFDNLHDASGILSDIQKKVATMCQADESFLQVNGSTGGVLVAISAAVSKGGKILMARNCHKSAYHAVYLRELEVQYLYPPILEGFDYYDAVTPKQVEEELRSQKTPGEIKAVMIVSPSYEGRIADVQAIAEITHKYQIPLIVDEAHGAHLGFAEGFALNSNQLGADLVIQSVHKTLPALTQTALLHVNGNLIDRNLVKRFCKIFQTSSPSYLLMASIENGLNLVEIYKESLFGEFRKNYLEMIRKLSDCCRYLRFVDRNEYDQEPIRQDVGKLVIDCSKAPITGKQLYDRLRDNYHIQLEMACEKYCLAMFTIADDKEAYERMMTALSQIDASLEKLQNKGFSEIYSNSESDTSMIMTEQPVININVIRDQSEEISFWKAWDLETQRMPLKDAKGYIAGEFISLYPPGSPVLVPGEMITEKHLEQINSCLEKGLHVEGIYF